MSVTVSIAQINSIVGSLKQNQQKFTDAIGKDRRYPIASHYRWILA